MRRFLALAVSTVALLGCPDGGNDSPTGPNTASMAGTWILVSSGGSTLPVILSESGGLTAELTSDVRVFTTGGSFTVARTVRTTFEGQVTTSPANDAGTYTTSGSSVTLTYASDGSTATGSVNGSVFTLTDHGVVLVFGKQ